MGDLKKWVNQKWVDIGAPKKDGKYQPCGRKSASGSKRNYPKCVPIAKARAMSKGQRAGAVKRKQAKANVGPTPDRAATFAKRKTAANGGYMGSFIKLNVDGKTIGNPSLKKYYKGMV
jgi:ABC-type phosphate transport system substrate-binding protein